MRKHNILKRHDSRGMSLIELIVVMAIMSIVMMAVISLYVPVHQSTVAQTQVSDVQSNLRLAVKTMTRDLLIAGFLMPFDPIIFPDFTPAGDPHLTNLTSPGTANAADFTIRTRAVGNGFARISVVDGAAVATGFRLTVTDSEMSKNFPVGSKVRLFEPVTGSEVIAATGTNASRAYTVLASVGTTIDITGKPPGGALLTSDILEETVMVRIKDENAPALQTIRYLFADGALKRIVNDAEQVLARNVDPANSSFSYSFTDEGRVNRVDIKLTGITQALKDDAISGEKSRAIETSVKLRNVN